MRQPRSAVPTHPTRSAVATLIQFDEGPSACAREVIKFWAISRSYDNKRVAMAGWVRTSRAMARGMLAWPCLRMARRACWNGRNAGHEHGGGLLRSIRARLLVNGRLMNGLLMNGRLPAANEGARWRFA